MVVHVGGVSEESGPPGPASSAAPQCPQAPSSSEPIGRCQGPRRAGEPRWWIPDTIYKVDCGALRSVPSPFVFEKGKRSAHNLTVLRSHILPAWGRLLGDNITWFTVHS